MSFIPFTWNNRAFTFIKEQPVGNVTHEMLEKLLSAYPGLFEVVAVGDIEKMVVIKENITPEQPVIETVAEPVIRRRGRRKVA